MSKTRVLITIGCCLCFMAISASGQGRKPGLWEVTTTTTWQQSPMPAGMTMPQGANSPFSGGTYSAQACYTQPMIDKLGAPMPQNRNSQCQVTNVKMKPGGMSGDWVCTGMMAGKGPIEGSWTDPEHTKVKVHFIGSMRMGPNAIPVEYTTVVNSVYKGADCGSVKPVVMPDK